MTSFPIAPRVFCHHGAFEPEYWTGVDGEDESVRRGADLSGSWQQGHSATYNAPVAYLSRLQGFSPPPVRKGASRRLPRLIGRQAEPMARPLGRERPNVGGRAAGTGAGC
ncbi:hypothetical protein C2845_PM15G00360 [Panicum miliaceum]|uniref:Uncharacterized protein n=1 Tax=Panicum miliaceum TaxID=4540 RepID=A0A3L6QD59_PANMI|nr:hypothetical protein C2845_PM15G00360 [Panicum miliaceum]